MSDTQQYKTVGEFFAANSDQLEGLITEGEINKLTALKLSYPVFDKMKPQMKFETILRATGATHESVAYLFGVVFPDVEISVNIQVEPATPSVEKPKNSDLLGGLNMLAHLADQTYWNKPAVEKAARVLRVIGLVALGVDEMIAKRLNEGTLANVQDHHLNSDLQNWLYKRAADGGSFMTSDGQMIEVVPAKMRREALTKFLDFITSLTPLDRAIRNLSLYGDARDRTEFLEFLKVSTDQSVQAATPAEVKRSLMTALEVLTDFSNKGIATHTMMLIAGEINFLAEKVFNSAQAVNAMGFSVDNANPFMSLVRGLKNAGLTNGVRESILYSETLFGLIMAMIHFAEQQESDMGQLANLIGPSQMYLRSTQEFGLLHDQKSQPGITGIVNALRVSLSVKIGGVSVNVDVGVGAKASFYTVDPADNNTNLTQYEALAQASNLITTWIATKSSPNMITATSILTSYLPEAAISQLQGKLPLTGNSYAEVAEKWVSITFNFAVMGKDFPHLQPASNWMKSIAVLLSNMVKDMPHHRKDLERLVYFFARLPH